MSRRLAIIIAIVALFLLSGCVVKSHVDEIEYFAVNGVLTVDKMKYRDSGNSYPWDTQAPVMGDHGFEFVVSNSCGFAEIRYHGVQLSNLLNEDSYSEHQVTVLQSMGEWCQVAELLYESPTLVKVRNWSGIRYELSSALIYEDSRGDSFVADKEFIEDSGFVDMVVSIEHGKEGHECFLKEYFGDEVLRSIKEKTATEDFGDRLCIARGVYLAALQKAVGALSPVVPAKSARK